MKNSIAFLILLILFVTKGFSQRLSPVTLNSTGGSGVDKSMYFEWSVGEETAIETMISGNIVVTHGILQPIGQIPNLDECWGPEEIKIFPNPVTDWITIDLVSTQTGKVSLILFDESLRLITKQSFDYFGFDHIEKMNFSNYPSGAYILNILLEPTGTSIAKKCAYKIVKLR